MRHSAVNISRLREVLDWTPETTIETGVRRTSEFRRSRTEASPLDSGDKTGEYLYRPPK